MPRNRPFHGKMLILLCVIACVACEKKEQPVEEAFFVFSTDGELEPCDDLFSLPSIPLKAWPNQIRVTDIRAHDGRIFCAINGHGIVEVSVDKDRMAIRSYYQKKYFSGRTTTLLASYGDTLFCHVYRDVDFVPNPQEAGGIGRTGDELCFVKIRFHELSPVFTPFISRFQKETCGREAVMAKILDEKTVVLQWKEREEDHIRISYSILNLKTGEEEETSREWFSNSFQVRMIDQEKNISGFGSLLRAIADGTGSGSTDYTVLFMVHGDSGEERHFSFTTRDDQATDDMTYYSVLVIAAIDHWTALFPDGKIIRIDSAKEQVLSDDRLPNLPIGYRYTGFIERAGFLCASWEQMDFYRVGRSGIFIRRM